MVQMHIICRCQHGIALKAPQLKVLPDIIIELRAYIHTVLVVNPVSAKQLTDKHLKCTPSKTVFPMLGAVSKWIKWQIDKEFLADLAFKLMPEVRCDVRFGLQSFAFRLNFVGRK